MNCKLQLKWALSCWYSSLKTIVSFPTNTMQTWLSGVFGLFFHNRPIFVWINELTQENQLWSWPELDFSLYWGVVLELLFIQCVSGWCHWFYHEFGSQGPITKQMSLTPKSHSAPQLAIADTATHSHCEVLSSTGKGNQHVPGTKICFQ